MTKKKTKQNKQTKNPRNQLMNKYTNKNQWPLRSLVFILECELCVCVCVSCVLAGVVMCAERKEAAAAAAVSHTHHSPHTVCGSRANRVVVGVCCCIDSAIAAQREATENTVIDLSLTRRAEHLCMLV